MPTQDQIFAELQRLNLFKPPPPYPGTNNANGQHQHAMVRSRYYLTTIGGPWYYDRAVVFQRLINQSFYQEILLLQKFNDIGGKVLKPKKIQPPTSKK